MSALPHDAQARKEIPMVRGLLDYFPAALAAVAEVSRIGNEQHNPGEEMHWARGKSTDHADCIVRHLVDRGTPDVDGVRHTAKVAWRALALLQEELERDGGAVLPRAARLEPVPVTRLTGLNATGSVVPIGLITKEDQDACGLLGHSFEQAKTASDEVCYYCGLENPDA